MIGLRSFRAVRAKRFHADFGIVQVQDQQKAAWFETDTVLPVTFVCFRRETH